MSEQEEWLFRIVGRLEAVGIPYMVVGSCACAVHGEPRFTNDVDIVIDPTAKQLESFLGTSVEHEYVSHQAARDSLRRRGMFNLIDTSTGWKVDLICRKDRPFSREEFRRRTPREFEGRTIFTASPEDAILSKLVWAKRADSERQLRDAAGIVRVSGPLLDRDYLARWGDELGVRDELQGLFEDASDDEPRACDAR